MDHGVCVKVLGRAAELSFKHPAPRTYVDRCYIICHKNRDAGDKPPAMSQPGKLVNLADNRKALLKLTTIHIYTKIANPFFIIFAIKKMIIKSLT